MGWIRYLLRGYAHELIHRVSWRVKLQGIRSRRPVLVYQMGKVGSSTVAAALRRLPLAAPVLHMHTLMRPHLTQAIRKQRRSSRPYLPQHLIVSDVLTRHLDRGLFPCRIITLTREPIGRAISFLFEDHAKQIPKPIGQQGIDVATAQAALTRLLTGDNGIADPTRWFDQELKARFGVDVFSVPYNVEQGYTLLRQGDVEVLVMRVEDFHRALPEALAALLHLDPAAVTVSKANVGTAKWYAEALREVKTSYQVPEELAEQVLHTQYMQHFYRDELEALQARWVAS